MEKVAEQVPVEKYNVDENQELARNFSVRSIPIVILVDNNDKEIERILGNNTVDFYINKFKEYEK
jgi:thiol-disulfide isomerase/thioredoxin